MASKLEQRIRDLDNPHLTEKESAIIISKSTGIKYGTALAYINVSRRGYTNAEYRRIIREKNKQLRASSKESLELIPIEEFSDIPAPKQEYSEIDIAHLFSCLKQLKPAYRHLLINRYLEEKTLQEIADENLTRVCRERIRQLETKAIKQLREIFFSQEHPSAIQSLGIYYTREH